MACGVWSRRKIGDEVRDHGWGCVDKEEGTCRHLTCLDTEEKDWKGNRGVERKPMAKGFMHKEEEEFHQGLKMCIPDN